MHRRVEPAIHYWGTPVVLISTHNPDGSTNAAPMSSAWWLGWTCVLGLDASSRAVENLTRTGECVLNLCGVAQVAAVNALARTTGSPAVPLHKRLLGYRHEPDKLGAAGLATVPSQEVGVPRLADCPVQLEARLRHVRSIGARDPRMSVLACAVEVQILAAHVEEGLLAEAGRVDPVRWRPLTMRFRELFEAGGVAAAPSRLASGDEDLYAPWKRRGVAGLAAKVLRRVSHGLHAISESSHE